MVIIASKRHHIRFFPQKSGGDKNAIALPGTLVETGVTQPYENDSNLCAHAAIKGTARPVHYSVAVAQREDPDGCALGSAQSLAVGNMYIVLMQRNGGFVSGEVGSEGLAWEEEK
jgi:hypothetical protein